MSIYTSSPVHPYVYKLIHRITKQFYYGYRCKNVKLNLTSSEDFGITYFTSSKIIKAMGFDNFDYEIIAEFYTADDAFQFENELIKENFHNDLILNGFYCDSQNKAWKHNRPHSPETKAMLSNIAKNRSAETRKKLSDAATGKIMSEETKALLRESCTGWHHTEETKAKISKSNIGKTYSEQARLNMSEGAKGKKFSDEAKANMSKAGKGRIFSQEHKDKISQALQGKKRTLTKKPKSGDIRATMRKINCAWCGCDIASNNFKRHQTNCEVQSQIIGG